MFYDDDKTAAVLISFLIGGIVGAGAALLLAPQSGKKTRGKIADLTEDAWDSAYDYGKKLKKKIS